MPWASCWFPKSGDFGLLKSQFFSYLVLTKEEPFEMRFFVKHDTQKEKIVKPYLLMLLVISLAITACTAGNDQSSTSILGSWKLTFYGQATSPTPAVADTEAGLTFNQDGTVTGNSGCNGLGGGYKVKGDQITFDQIVSTLMACDAPRMEQESVVHQVLTDTATYKIEGNSLTLTNNDLVLVFTSVSYP
jgi:heat shock protein HslJ